MKATQHLHALRFSRIENDQHGGQSVPNFDYGMAPGVKKAYKRLYVTNLGKMLDFLKDIEDGVERMKALEGKIEHEYGVYPCMAWDNNYMELELEKELRKNRSGRGSTQNAGSLQEVRR